MTFVTEFGYWNAFAFAFAILVSLLISGALGEWAKRMAPEYRKGREEGKMFLSGEDESAVRELQATKELQVSCHNLFWGFREALRSYYTEAKKEHSGVLSQYTFWLIVVLAVVFLIVVIWGGA
ncbi:MAG: hypothetical protein H0M93_00670 [Methanophagales archaeon]|nr:hypothetical protein [Methanophagales archaeon]